MTECMRAAHVLPRRALAHRAGQTTGLAALEHGRRTAKPGMLSVAVAAAESSRVL